MRYRSPRTTCVQVRPLRSIAVAPRAMVAPALRGYCPYFSLERSCGPLLARRHRMRQDDSSPLDRLAACCYRWFLLSAPRTLYPIWDGNSIVVSLLQCQLIVPFCGCPYCLSLRNPCYKVDGRRVSIAASSSSADRLRQLQAQFVTFKTMKCISKTCQKVIDFYGYRASNCREWMRDWPTDGTDVYLAAHVYCRTCYLELLRRTKLEDQIVRCSECSRELVLYGAYTLSCS